MNSQIVQATKNEMRRNTMEIRILLEKSPFSDAAVVRENIASGMPDELACEPMNRADIVKQTLMLPYSLEWSPVREETEYDVLSLTYRGILPLFVKRVLNQLAVRDVIVEWREQGAVKR